jgi:CubicO group peptidase (beta-lactamase class C family)
MDRKAWTGLAAACVLAPSAASAADADADRITRVLANLQPPVRIVGRAVASHTLAEEMAAHHVPSVSIAVAQHGRIAWARAFGFADVAAGRPAGVRTLYQAGSISKPVAASGALRLVEESRLSLDAPANQQLTSWRIPDNDFTRDQPVTLRHLLSHTAGLTVHGFPGYEVGTPVPSVVQVLEGRSPANTAPVVVERQPGVLWNYSGGGLVVAQLMMTDASGQSFPELMRQRVFAPLDMSASTYEQPLPAARGEEAASGYLRGGAPVPGRFHTYPEMAAAGLWTTPTDLASWAIALSRAYNGEPSALMSRASARAMLTPGLGHWGLGVEVMGDGADLYFHHSGDDAGFNANLIGWPEGERAIVVMTNSDDGLLVATELIQAVAREYGWKGLEPRVIAPATLTQAQVAEVAGSYGHGMVVISANGGKLGLIYGGVSVDLIPLGADDFVADPAGANVSLKVGRGPGGKVSTVAAMGLTIARDP